MAQSATQAKPAYPKRPLRYLRIGNVTHNFANNVAYAMQTALLKLGVRHRLSPRNNFHRHVSRAMATLKLIHHIAPLSKTVYLSAGGQGNEHSYFPCGYFHEVVPWIFDAWPNLFPKIERILRRQHIRLAFCSARQSADHFSRKLGIECLWLPEACAPSMFDPSLPLVQRGTDVLELGRKYDHWHDAIVDRLAGLGKVHLYEKVRGQHIFATDQALREGFNTAKISVCFPSSLTHPARSGNVETVTLRYFESMAAKCLIVGRCPAELRDVMGYNPVIEIDEQSPADQIEHILANIGEYQPMLDRNYQAMLERGSWDVRIRQLLSELSSRGYEAETFSGQGIQHP